MNKVPDRAKMRREYVAAKTHASMQMLIGGIFMFVCGASAVAGVAGMVILAADSEWLEAVCAFGFLIICVVLTVLGGLLFQQGCEMKDSISYVPPIHEQLPALPAKEVLLGGSDSPPAAPEELLRPAACQETPAEELLRPGMQ